LPPFQFYVATNVTPVTHDDAVWRKNLPSDRHQTAVPDETITYGEYFETIRLFLAQDRFTNLITAIARQSTFHKKITPDDIGAVHIFQEKHGAFYHPARLEVNISARRLCFALNVALSEAGLNGINREYAALRHLNHTFPFHFLPEVYLKGEITTNNGKKSIGIVMAEWLDGYDEFHLSRKANGKSGIIVWDQKQGAQFLPENQIPELYTQAAEILTCYYNIDTYEQIFPWHHGAGDFVLKSENEGVTVRLITVRQYAAMLDDDNAGESQDDDIRLEALLLFLMNLTIRMRLDRLDGVGEIAWADDIAVSGVLKGFFSGLALKVKADQITATFIRLFQTYLTARSESDLSDLAASLITACHPQAPDIPVIQRNLDNHIRVLHQAISDGHF